MKKNKVNLRLPTLEEFQNLVNFLSDDIKALNFQNYWYLTSDQPENKTFVQVFNPIENDQMIEHISYEYNVRLVYDDGISIEWEKNDEVSLVKKGKTKFTFEQAQEHIHNVQFDAWYSSLQNAIKNENKEIFYNNFSKNDIINQIDEINESVENIKEAYEERIELLEDEIKRLRIIIEYLENQNGYKI
jgi:hypothetical protein